MVRRAGQRFRAVDFNDADGEGREVGVKLLRFDGPRRQHRALRQRR